jgi:DNA-binding LacI/PurR family transcriptional regulator
MAKRVGIREVAREAGVSITTVSHALNNKGRVPAATRQRIREVADSLGYRPNASARTLVGGRSGLIAVAFSLGQALAEPVTDIDYYNQAIRSATARALTHGYALIVGPPTYRVEMWHRLPLEGMVVFDPVTGDPLLPQLRRQQVPMVLTGADPDSDADDYCVDNDHTAATRLVLDHLWQGGARRIALVGEDARNTFTRDCLDAYRRWCGEHGLAAIEQMAPTSYTAADARDIAHALLERGDRPDAVYANDEELGVAVLLAAESLSVRVPEDLLVATCADVQEFGHLPVEMTTLELDPAATAAAAVDLLIDLIEGRTPERRRIVIPSRLVPRASSLPGQRGRPT